MNNLRKSLKELFQVNHDAGLLRIFLAATLTFILWSLLAAISASFKPLGSLNLGTIMGLNSQNLAYSLFLDIFNAYFSTFTILLLILFLLVAFLSFDSIADFYTHLKSFPSKRISKNHLTFCAFSFPKRKKILIPDDFFNFSGDFPDGPQEAEIKPGYALLVGSRANYSVKFNNNDNSDIFEVSLAFREKIIDCFNLNPASISFNTKDQRSIKSFLIEVEYSFDLPTDIENTAIFANMLALCDSTRIRKIIESILSSETEMVLSHFFLNSSMPFALPLGQVPEKPIRNAENITKGLEQKKHTLFFNFFKKAKTRSLKEIERGPFI